MIFAHIVLIATTVSTDLLPAQVFDTLVVSFYDIERKVHGIQAILEYT